MNGGSERAWSLEGARALLADVRARTERAVAEVEDLLGQREGVASGHGREQLDLAIELRIARWVREMEALGVEVRGAWHVDFQTASGCFCWQWPEAELLHFHGADQGLEDRTRIQ